MELNLKGFNDSVLEGEHYTRLRFVLYPDSTDYNCAAIIENIEKLLATPKCNYLIAWICHDKDVREDGTPLKPHYHFVVKLTSGHQTPSAFRKKVGLPTDFYMKTFDNFEESLAYLIHFDSKG